MTIRAQALSDDPLDGTVGLRLKGGDGTTEHDFGDVGWTRTWRREGDFHYFNVVQLVGGVGDSQVIKISGGAIVFDGIPNGDYVAFDSSIVWHIPAADLDPDFDPEGGSYETVWMHFMIDE